jgi:hypothetical protein
MILVAGKSKQHGTSIGKGPPWLYYNMPEKQKGKQLCSGGSGIWSGLLYNNCSHENWPSPMRTTLIPLRVVPMIESPSTGPTLQCPFNTVPTVLNPWTLGEKIHTNHSQAGKHFARPSTLKGCEWASSVCVIYKSLSSPRNLNLKFMPVAFFS